MFYINYTVQAWKDDVLLFERDCELGIEYDLPDGRRGPVDWDVNEFHFTDTDKAGKPIYTKINRHEPLFHVMYNGLDTEWIDDHVRETLANEGRVNRYPRASYA